MDQQKAALRAQGRWFVVADPGETTDVLVRAVIEVFTSLCTRLCRRRGPRDRVMRGLMAAQRESGGAA